MNVRFPPVADVLPSGLTLGVFGFKRRRLAKERIEQAVTLAVQEWRRSDEELRARLISTGALSEDEAQRLIGLLPSALVTPTLEAHGMSLHPEVSGRDGRGAWMLAKLRKQPEYVVALKLARRQADEPVFDQAAFEAVIAGSAEYDVLRQALEEGVETRGGVVATSLAAEGIADRLVGPLRPSPPEIDATG